MAIPKKLGPPKPGKEAAPKIGSTACFLKMLARNTNASAVFLVIDQSRVLSVKCLILHQIQKGKPLASREHEFTVRAGSCFRKGSKEKRKPGHSCSRNSLANLTLHSSGGENLMAGGGEPS